VTLLRRAPREVYRIYSEEEFFDGASGMELFTPTNSSGRGERRLRRLAGVAMLAGAVGMTGGAVVLAGSRPTRGPGRRVGDGAAQALARARLVTRVGAQLRTLATGGSDVARSTFAVGRARSVLHARAAHLALAGESARRSRIARGVRAEHAEQREDHDGDARVSAGTLAVDTASGSAPVPAPSDGAPAPAPAAASPGSPSRIVPTPPPALSVERAEFGFER
jgi:hypothetical protein